MKKKNEDKKSNIGKLEKTFFGLVIAGLIGIIILTISLNDPGNMFNGLLIIIPMILIPSLLVFLTTLYFVIKGCIYFHNKGKKQLIIYILVLIATIVVFVFAQYFRYKRSYHETWGHSLYDGAIYQNNFYYFDKDLKGTKEISNLLYIDSNGKEKLLCDNIPNGDKDELIFGDGDYLYYSEHPMNNKRININTCEIENLNKDYKYLLNTKREDYIYMLKIYGAGEIEYSVLLKYDYKNKKVLNEVDIDDILYNNNFIIDYDTDDLYYIATNNNNYYLAKNKDMLYGSDEEIFLIAKTNTHIIFGSKDTIYKYNLNDNIIESSTENVLGRVKLIFSGTNSNYFTANDIIFKYDEELDDFIKLSETSYSFYDLNAYEMNGKVGFTNEYDKLLVYDYVNNKLKIYDGLSQINYYDNKFYIMNNYDESDITVIE